MNKVKIMAIFSLLVRDFIVKGVHILSNMSEQSSG